jgi:NTE family protein
MTALITGGRLVAPPHSLFDNSPLWELLRKHLDFDGIPRSVQRGCLKAIGICATCYGDADSVTFFAGSERISPWKKTFRKGERVALSLDHLMASLAIPFLFRPSLLGDQYYGDGAMRQTSPLSPAVHLGADRLLIIGVGDPEAASAPPPAAAEPTFGQMFGFMMDSLFMDQIYADLERIRLYNELGDARQIQTLMIMPSENLTEIAQRHAREIPRSLQALLRILGANNPAGNQLLSYMLFERAYTRELIALGFRDAHAQERGLRAFLGSAAALKRRWATTG